MVARLRKAYVATAEDDCANPWLLGAYGTLPRPTEQSGTLRAVKMQSGTLRLLS
jgi:hypothetical protein